MEFPASVKNKRLQGRQGESEAVSFLENKGYRIIRRNFGKRGGEIDVIAEDPEKTLVFVEVKTAFQMHFGDPAFWVSKKKQRTIGKIAEIYLAEENLQDRKCRFDVVTVIMKKGQRPAVNHFENAFMITY